MEINNGMTRIETMAVDDIIKLIDKYDQIITVPHYPKINEALENAIISQLKLMTLGDEYERD